MKHLVRLYPKRWRDRYGAEFAAFLEHQRMSAAGVIDLVRGAADAHLHPALGSQLVFVPTIGFRPAGTRTLLERSETAADGTHVTILAVAATPERTELIIEWEQQSNAAVCISPDSRTEAAAGETGAPPKRPPATAPPTEALVTAVILAGSTVLETTAMSRQAYRASGSGSWAVRSMIFPPVPRGTTRAELQVSQGDVRWIVPFRLVPGRLSAEPVAAAVTRDDITVRVIAAARHEDQLVVGVEVTAAQPIGSIGAPAPAMPILPSGRKFKVARGGAFEPIVLQDDRGVRHQEIRRIHALRDQPDSHIDGEMFVQRFSIFFDAPGAEARSAALVVPFVEIRDQRPSVVVDLRHVPLDVSLGEHWFRVPGASVYEGSDYRQIRLEVAKSTMSPRFVRPAAVQGARGGSYSWSRPSDEPMWMATEVGDPPLVTFRGAVLRYDGPWRLEFPLP